MFVRLNTPKMDLTQLVTKSEIPTKLSRLENDINLITKTEVQDMLDSIVVPPDSGTTIFVPTKLSQLENDMGFLTQHQDISHLALKSEILTKVSQLENDKEYISYFDLYIVDKNGDYIVDENGDYIMEKYASVQSVEKLQEQINELKQIIQQLQGGN